jgi:serine/threonine-protein kinase
MPVPTAVDIVRQVCRGLALAHGEKPPIVHRDVKPQNILVGYEPEGLRARLSDFGLARRVNPLTLLASARGTRSFKPPEAFADPQRDSCAGDVWALGSTLYLLLTDRLPFSEVGDFDDWDDARFERPLIPPSRLNVQVDPGLDQVLFRALAVAPEGRYPTATAMLADLERWEPGAARPAREKGEATQELSKTALGERSPIDAAAGRKKLQSALALARRPGKLAEAADLMEEALNALPDLRQGYEQRLRLWRRGIAM